MNQPADVVKTSVSKPLGHPSISRTFVFWTLIAGSGLGGFLVIISLSRGQQTPNEALLLSILLTLLSIGFSWLITHTFYQDDRRMQIAAIKQENEENLRIYAVKAAEKVINLSSQISRLVSYLDSEDYSASGGGEESYKLLCEKMRASLHMLETLRSMNETSLSDWEGVIGDRLDARRRIDEKRNDEIQVILEEIRAAAKDTVGNDVVSKTELQKLFLELKDLSLTTTALPPVRRALSAGLKCPACDSEVRIKTNSKGHIRKVAVVCRGCQTSLVVQDGKSAHPYLEIRRNVVEMVSCASCSTEAAVPVDNVVPSTSSFRCDSCGIVSLAIRNDAGVSSKLPTGQKTRVDQNFIEQVYMMLPPQPWPTGVHHEIAEKLGKSGAQVGKAIQELIRLDRVKDQANGAVIEKAE